MFIKKAFVFISTGLLISSCELTQQGGGLSSSGGRTSSRANQASSSEVTSSESLIVTFSSEESAQQVRSLLDSHKVVYTEFRKLSFGSSEPVMYRVRLSNLYQAEDYRKWFLDLQEKGLVLGAEIDGQFSIAN